MRTKFSMICPHCGSRAPQTWDKAMLKERLRRETLQLWCFHCDKRWSPAPHEQEGLIKILYPEFSESRVP